MARSLLTGPSVDVGLSRAARARAWAWTLAALAAACGARAPAEEEDLLRGRSVRVATFTSEPNRIADGVVARDGDAFATGLTSQIEAGGGVEWDLGERRRVRRATIGADHDDVYVLSVSDDGRRWSEIWEAPAVAAKGQQRRTSPTLDAVGRFVRLEPRAGDSRYAVSELVLSQSERPAPAGVVEEQGAQERDPAKYPSRAALGIALLVVVVAFWRGRSRSATRVLAAALAAALLLIGTAVTYASEYRFRVIDDAYISFQYAKNWAFGQGLVFNVGERVEGYTNFAWIAVMTPLFWLARDAEVVTLLVLALNVALGAAGLALVAAIGWRVFAGRALPIACALLLVAFDDSYVAYTVLGLEKHLLAVAMLLGLWLRVTAPRGWDVALGLSFAAAVLTRPDGLLWPLSFFAAELSRFVVGDPREQRPRLAPLLRAAGIFVALVVAYFCARVAYFGDPLPNTFYLKVGRDFEAVARGLGYVREFVTDRYGVPLLALGALVSLRSGWIRWLALHAALHVLYVVYVGGDFYPGHRFLLVLIPTAALLTAAGVDGVASRWAGPAARLALGAVAVLACLAVRVGTLEHGPYPAEIRRWASTIDHNVRYMQWLGGVARPGSSLVLGDIGAAGLFAGVRVVDVFGVVDPVIARKAVAGFGTGKAGHEKVASPAEALARNPTYLKFGYVDARDVPADFYLFNDFPRSLRVAGLWVRDDVASGRELPATRWSMSRAELAKWTRSGAAFADSPSARARSGQAEVVGQRGTFLNTYSSVDGDDATGRLLSPEFELVGDRVRLLVGGGRDPERLRVSLLVGGERAFSETGTNFETLGRREWDVRELRGRRARIEIVDEARGAWGHLLVDEIAQLTGPCASGTAL